MFFEGKPQLLRAFREGEASVLRDLYVAYGEQVFRYCRERLQSPADARDLAQDVFVTAFQAETRRRFSGMSSFQGFLLGIAKNLLLHRYRADRVRQAGAERIASSAPEEAAEPPEVDRRIEQEAAEKTLQGFLAELAEREREFFLRHMMPRPPRRETAERFKMTEDQVRYLEKKLRQKAIDYLKRSGYLDSAGASLVRAASAAVLLLVLLPVLGAPGNALSGESSGWRPRHAERTP